MNIKRQITFTLFALAAMCFGVFKVAAQPGTAVPATSGMNTQKPGSVLFYPYYKSDIMRPQVENTKINITNTHLTQMVYAHIFFIDTSNCQPADSFVCLTANQTFSFIASDYDPGITGYLLVVAVSKDTGLPIQFNNLIGDYYFRLLSGHEANLGAEAFAALKDPPATLNTDGATFSLKFDDVNYNSAPRVLAVDSIASRADGNETMLVLTRIGGDLVNGADYNLGGLLGLVYDDTEKGFSFTMAGGNCQYRTIISDSAPRLVPRFTSIIRAGHHGWIKMWPSANIPMVGFVVNFHPTPSTANYSGGHTLHTITNTTAGVFTLPVFMPTC